jgi:hypothetical protein
MAIAEACQLWIEQRIEEELQDRPENGKSLREIGRELAKEIEKVFEAKVKPRTLEKKAGRMGATFVAPPENPGSEPVDVATSGYKPKPQEVAQRVESLVEKGASIREAAKVVAEETGKTPSSVRQAYARERDKLVAEWVELTGEKVGQVAQVYGGRGNKEGISEASRQLGVERTEVRRALKVASLSPEAQDAAREVGLDTAQNARQNQENRGQFSLLSHGGWLKGNDTL